ncbi:hypothetical protein MMYC01_204255 [Madurella mycetomatis]|uniref:Uncharacterized protein n=1 Tax=Madurella mycetomatis TaxID=100816 RepID=A0A175WA81_9PEZI|nr:hypothetical protein MMYC01_204255 [Madurella mycetomatis]
MTLLASTWATSRYVGSLQGANGNGNESGIDGHSSNAAAGAQQSTPGQGEQSQPTPTAGSGSGASDNGGNGGDTTGDSAGGTAGGTAGAEASVNPTTVTVFAPGATGSPSFTGDNFDPNGFDGLQGGAGSEYTGGAGGDRGDGRNGDGGDGGTAEAQHPSSLGGIIGGIIAILVVLFVLAALIYRYRRTRHVQAFLRKFTPFKISPYTKSEKKRSSMGAGLLFTDGLLGDALMNEKRSTVGYGTTLPPPVTHPNPAMARPERPDGPPVINTVVANNRASTPISPCLIDVSPLSPGFPMSPPPTVAKRSSQDSLGGVSIASSGIFSPSLLSWPMPPSEAPSTTTSRPPSPHGAEMAARYPPMPPLKPMTPLSPSNWQKPPNWD